MSALDYRAIQNSESQIGGRNNHCLFLFGRQPEGSRFVYRISLPTSNHTQVRAFGESNFAL